LEKLEQRRGMGDFPHVSFTFSISVSASAKELARQEAQIVISLNDEADVK
jgi:hypothetical protein